MMAPRPYRLVVAAVVCCAWPAAAQAQDRVIGLLKIPEVFGNGSCDTFTPVAIAVFAAPGAAHPVGTIEAEDRRAGAGTSKCTGAVDVRVRKTAGSAVREPLPTDEFSYDERGAIVLAERNDWYRVRLSDGSAWLRPPPAASFHTLDKLYAHARTHFTEHWDGRLAQSPGGALSRVALDVPHSTNNGQDLNVLRSTWIKNELWYYVAIISEICGHKNVAPLQRGWVPAYTKSGQNTIWFYARGC
jgi:hypothetical protein